MSRSTAHRGQQSIEFLPYVAIAFALLVLFVMIMAFRVTSVHEQELREELDTVVNAVHSEIRAASSVSDGYERNFTLPLIVDSTNYTIQIVAGNTVIASAGRFEASTVTFNVSGQPIPGKNTIRKDYGEISLN